jgi:hypothetical protein
MARILVTADFGARAGAPVVLDERVLSIHLSDGHAAEQLIERLGWAITDAEELGRGGRDGVSTPLARRGTAAILDLETDDRET